MKTSRHWSDEDEKLCRAMIDAGMTSEEAGLAVGRTARAVRNKMCSPKATKVHSKSAVQPSSECLLERDRRRYASPRDLTAALMGDPPVGFSALERRT